MTKLAKYLLFAFVISLELVLILAFSFAIYLIFERLNQQTKKRRNIIVILRAKVHRNRWILLCLWDISYIAYGYKLQYTFDICPMPERTTLKKLMHCCYNTIIRCVLIYEAARSGDERRRVLPDT